MNREILFRGKCVDNGEWVEGFYVRKTDPLLTGVSYHFILTQERDNTGCLMSFVTWTRVIPETVGQYTGLNDKNGKKIFEGDICNVCRGADIETGVIYYDERVGAWGVRYNKKECNLLFDIFTSKDTNVWIEVIGNIHDGGIDDGKNAEKD